MGTMESGIMTFLPTVGEKGALAVFGERKTDQVMTSFRIIFKDRTFHVP